MAEETVEKVEEAAAAAPEGSEALDEWRRRAEASHKEREEIFRRNGLLKEGESLPADPAAIDARCC